MWFDVISFTSSVIFVQFKIFWNEIVVSNYILCQEYEFLIDAQR